MAERDSLTDAVLRKRDEYSKKEEVFQFFEEAYKGGDDYISSNNLFLHTFEDDESFKERSKRAYYYNYCAPIVNAYNAFIYKPQIKRDFGNLAEDELFKQFEEDSDMQGNSYDAFWREVSKWSSVSGIRFVLVDKPAEVAENKRDEIEGGLRPYFVHIDPKNVWDWGLDKFGNLLWIKVLETAQDEEDFKDDKEEVQRFRIWYKDRWELYEVSKDDKEEGATLIEEDEHPIGEVPIIPVCHFSEEPMQGQSLLNDIAYVNRALFNWCSLLDEILYRQTFSQLTLPEDPDNPIDSQELGTSRGLAYPHTSSNKPEFISPDASQATVLMNQIAAGVEEIYRLATLRGAIGVTEQSSGVARSYDFMITNNTLANKALNMEEAEMKALTFWAKWQEKENPEHTIEYPREFEISSLEAEIKNALDAQTLKISNIFMGKLKENIVKRMMPRLSKEDMDKIVEEIESQSEVPGTEPTPGSVGDRQAQENDRIIQSARTGS